MKPARARGSACLYLPDKLRKLLGNDRKGNGRAWMSTALEQYKPHVLQERVKKLRIFNGYNRVTRTGEDQDWQIDRTKVLLAELRWVVAQVQDARVNHPEKFQLMGEKWDGPLPFRIIMFEPQIECMIKDIVGTKKADAAKPVRKLTGCGKRNSAAIAPTEKVRLFKASIVDAFDKIAGKCFRRDPIRHWTPAVAGKIQRPRSDGAFQSIREREGTFSAVAEAVNEYRAR